MVNVKICKRLPQIVAQALTVAEIYILISSPTKVGQGQGVQFSQLYHSLANVKIYKCLPHIFELAFAISEI